MLKNNQRCSFNKQRRYRWLAHDAVRAHVYAGDFQDARRKPRKNCFSASLRLWSHMINIASKGREKTTLGSQAMSAFLLATINHRILNKIPCKNIKHVTWARSDLHICYYVIKLLVIKYSTHIQLAT